MAKDVNSRGMLSFFLCSVDDNDVICVVVVVVYGTNVFIMHSMAIFN